MKVVPASPARAGFFLGPRRYFCRPENKTMQVNSEVMDQKDPKPEDVLAENGLLKQLTKALLQYTLNAQSTPVRQDLGYPRFAGFDDKIVSMFARGTSESGIRKRLDFIYGVDLSPSLISE